MESERPKLFGLSALYQLRNSWLFRSVLQRTPWRHHRWLPMLDPTLDLVSDRVLDQKTDQFGSIAMNP
jgi:hypothetical protein